MPLKSTFSFSLVFIIAVVGLRAQSTIDQVSTGAGYSQFDYYKLSDGSDQQVDNAAWDIAFCNLGVQQAGIFVNESTSSSMGQTQPGVEAYYPGSSDFNLAINPADLTADKQIFNPEASWAEGAFNTVRDPNNPLDYGWGTYIFQQNKVLGTRVFALKLRNGQYRKLLFESFNGQTYQFKAANLDGSNVQTYTVEKSNGNGSPVVYFSFSNSAPVTPVGWDLVFCRYNTPLFDGQGYIPYSVTGLLGNDGVQAAKAVGIDPYTVDYNDYLDSLNARLDVVGYDWKTFSGTAWSVATDRAYFVKTKTNQLFQLVFIDFEGSSTGTATLERTYLTQLSAAADLPAGIEAVSVYPNPVAGRLNIAFASTLSENARIKVLNLSGQTVYNGSASVHKGLNVLEVDRLPVLAAGQYVLQVQVANGQFSRKITVEGLK